ncbi:MAG TPA: nuclear transport factor 2 family protein [Oculatellaceae cyanobacterium]
MLDKVSISSKFIARPLSKSGEADLLSASDRLDMLDLIHTFGWCIDSQAYDVLATIVTEDFVHDHVLGVADGRDEFLQSLKNEKSFVGLRHENSNALFRSVDLSNAIAVTYLTLVRVHASGAGVTDSTGVSPAAGGQGGDGFPEIVAHGICTDYMKKEKDLWKLDKRVVDQMSVSQKFADKNSRDKFALTAKERHGAVSSSPRR